VKGASSAISVRLCTHVHQHLPGPLRDPGPGRVRDDSGQPHSAPVEFDDEQNVEPGQADRLDGEKSRAKTPPPWARRNSVAGCASPAPARAGDCAGCSGPRSRTPGCRGCCTRRRAAGVAPAGALSGHPQYQIDDRGVPSAPPVVPVGVGPPAPHQVPVPAQQCGRSNQERRPASRGNSLASASSGNVDVVTVSS